MTCSEVSDSGGMVRYHSAWLLPITGPPIRDAWIDICDGRILDFGTMNHRKPLSRKVRKIDLGCTAVLPGLVNAHTHLELSWLRGLVPPTSSLPLWVRSLLAKRAEAQGDESEAIVAAIEESWRSGTAIVGDISNTLDSVIPLSRGRLVSIVFKEILGFDVECPEDLVGKAVAMIVNTPSNERVRLGLAAHSPYSVSPGVFRSMKLVMGRLGPSPSCVHLAESKEELEFLRNGTGPWRELLVEKGKGIAHWEPPNCGPVEYLERLGWINEHVIVVHGVHLTEVELDQLARRNVVLVTCPRSNAWTGAGTPPIERFYASGVSVAIGTDSLASAPDMNLFSELAELRCLAPTVAAATLLKSATVRGAEAFGFGSDYGSIEPGRLGALISVRIPEVVEDVEEYLVSGIWPDDVSWLNVGMPGLESPSD